MQHDSMEFFGARTHASIDTSLQEVRNSDILVVIIGHKYGTLVPELGISYSEAEYNEGYLLGKPSLVYMRNESVLVLPKDVETDSDKIKLLNSWKRRLKERHTVAMFESSDDLAVQVAADLSRTIRKMDFASDADDSTQGQDGSSFVDVPLPNIEVSAELKIKEGSPHIHVKVVNNESYPILCKVPFSKIIDESGMNIKREVCDYSNHFSWSGGSTDGVKEIPPGLDSTINLVRTKPNAVGFYFLFQENVHTNWQDQGIYKIEFEISGNLIKTGTTYPKRPRRYLLEFEYIKDESQDSHGQFMNRSKFRLLGFNETSKNADYSIPDVTGREEGPEPRSSIYPMTERPEKRIALHKVSEWNRHPISQWDSRLSLYDPIPLAEGARSADNYPFSETLGIKPLLGKASVPFFLRLNKKSQFIRGIEVWPRHASDRDPSQEIIVEVEKVATAFVLLTAGNAWRRYKGVKFEGKVIGYLIFHFTEGNPQRVDLKLGHNIREWSYKETREVGVVDTVSDQSVEQVWRSKDNSQTMDMLSVDFEDQSRSITTFQVVAECKGIPLTYKDEFPRIRVTGLTIRISNDQPTILEVHGE